jgi:hypothetical protein
MKLRKRQKFVISSGILSFLMLLLEVLNIQQYRLGSIFFLGFLSLALGIWSLREGLITRASYLSLVLPVSFTVGVGLFFFLLPSNFLARIPVVVLYAIGMYAIMLTANIYTVASIRTIALLRAAQAVGYVLTLLSLFLIYDSVLSYRYYPWINVLVVAGVSFPLYLAGVWSVEASDQISSRLVGYAFVLGFVIGEISLVMSFWPVTITVGSLFLTTMGYILLGMAQHELSGRLFSQTVWEYIAVGVAVFATMLLTTKWGG